MSLIQNIYTALSHIFAYPLYLPSECLICIGTLKTLDRLLILILHTVILILQRMSILIVRK